MKEVFKRKLGFVAVGPERTGSTWLFRCLEKHPELCLPTDVKETDFLTEHFEKGWNWFWTHYECGDGKIPAEIAPTYFIHESAIQRLHEHNPNCRILISLRDPAERSFSFYRHLLACGYIRGAFEEAIHHHPIILESSRYSVHVPRWIVAFGAENVFTTRFKDIAERPEELLNDVCHFAGIRPVPLADVAQERINQGVMPAYPPLARIAKLIGNTLRTHRLHTPIKWARSWGLDRVYEGARALPQLSGDTRKKLTEIFEPDIDYAEELLGSSLPHWRSVDPND